MLGSAAEHDDVLRSWRTVFCAGQAGTGRSEDSMILKSIYETFASRLRFSTRSGLCLWAFASAAVLSPAGGREMRGQQTAQPESAAAQRRGSGISASLPQMYEYAFRLQNNLTKIAYDREKTGKSGTPARNLLAQRFGLPAKQIAAFNKAAKRFAEKEEYTNLRIHDIHSQDRTAHPNSPVLSEAVRPTVHTLVANLDLEASREMDDLRRSLGPELMKQLNEGVIHLYMGANAVRAKSSPAQAHIETVEPNLSAADAVSPLFCPPPPCSIPSGMATQIFAPDGTTVTATLTSTITQADSDNGCFPYANLQYDQDGTVVASDPEYGAAGSLTVTATTMVSVNIGSTYSFQDSFDESCDANGACGPELIFTTSFQTGAPNITNSPFSANIGESGAISVSGTNLGGPPGNSPTVAVTSGSGLSLNVSQPPTSIGSTATGTQSVNYSVDPSSQAGSSTFTLTTVWGTSNNATFNTNCGQPNITQVIPAEWVAGKQQLVQVTGSGFCPGVAATVNLSSGATLVVGAVNWVNSGNVSFSVTPDGSLQAQPGVLTLTNPAGLNASARISITNAAPAAKLYLIDPFLVSGVGASNTVVDPTAVVKDILNSSDDSAGGIIADGTSTMVAVYETQADEDVTFSVPGNLQLVGWDPNFLIASPTGGLQAGAKSITMTANHLYFNPTSSKYYGFALVRSPLPLTRADVSGQPVQQVRASQAGNGTVGPTSGASMVTLYQKPVLLVHGLWGDSTSFADVKPYLESHLPNLIANSIIPICYSRFIAYDAATDPYHGEVTDPYTGKGLGGCEDTAANAITGQLQQLQQRLDSMHIVEGQVDYVAHSMGGLVGRMYSSLPSSRATSFLLARRPPNPGGRCRWRSGNHSTVPGEHKLRR